jgi:hypothetical protein
MITSYTITRESDTAQKYRIDLIETIHNEALEICHPVKFDMNIIQFLSEIVIESLSYRKEEWLLRGIEPSEFRLSEIARLIRPSLFKLLYEAENSARNEEEGPYF